MRLLYHKVTIKIDDCDQRLYEVREIISFGKGATFHIKSKKLPLMGWSNRGLLRCLPFIERAWTKETNPIGVQTKAWRLFHLVWILFSPQLSLIPKLTRSNSIHLNPPFYKFMYLDHFRKKKLNSNTIKWDQKLLVLLF